MFICLCNIACNVTSYVQLVYTCRCIPLDTCLKHSQRVIKEHSYSQRDSSDDDTATAEATRHLPLWLQRFSRLDVQPGVPEVAVSDSVYTYATAVLTDGLLLMEFRDAIHEGDGDRVHRCYKFLMPYFHCTGHSKYALECFRYLCSLTIETMPSSTELAAQLKWSRFINTRGKQGCNVPVDFHMEHLNKVLKRLVLGLGANCTVTTMVNISKCIGMLQEVTSTIDKQLQITPEQSHHARLQSNEDEQLILIEIAEKSHVFQYVPGRQHSAYPTLSSSILHSLDADKYISWIQSQRCKVAAELKYKETLSQLQ